MPSLVAESLPTNLAEQREAFFRSGCKIDPQFEYKVSGKTRAQKAYGTPQRYLSSHHPCASLTSHASHKDDGAHRHICRVTM